MSPLSGFGCDERTGQKTKKATVRWAVSVAGRRIEDYRG
ncbi:hypothetical protein YT1_3605 [Rhodococcus ruber]|nr:hypothetical protein YT1_3605 [Rhodococcus ruber]